ncbi:EboA domain-containing protein [Streptomyces sp. NPDC095613]|uniref:EboA domain-containing protein n=1 Tax=Streptomyces sp. NPDC095613 TaxID=3155540 RepID=UPI003331854F
MTPTPDQPLPGLDPAARAWLDTALTEADRAAEAAEDTGTPGPAEAVGTAAPTGSGTASDNVAPAPWELRFAAAGRHAGRPHADAVRTLLLHRARAPLATLTRLYRHGTAAERRAVLLALPDRVAGPGALPLVEDALRTNDTSLVAAAVGPYAAAHLDPHAWRHAVLKCLFTGVPLDAVHDLERRAHKDTELARMLADFAAERTAAGRPVPADLTRALNLTGEES